MQKKYIIIVAGGKGIRMGSDVPKQFLILVNKPVLMHTLQVFYEYDSAMQIILCLPPDHFSYWKSLCIEYSFEIPHLLVEGGDTRFESVQNGLRFVDRDALVGIHDGVRPLVSRKTIYTCYEEALKQGNAIPCIEINDSVRMMNQGGNAVIDRQMIRIIQTPQVFQSNLVLESHFKHAGEGITDDAGVIEYFGHTVHLVEGNRENIKITSPEDLLIAQSIIQHRGLAEHF